MKSIGIVAKELDVSTDTIRKWDKAGLIKLIGIKQEYVGIDRIYSDEDIKKLKILKKLLKVFYKHKSLAITLKFVKVETLLKEIELGNKGERQ